ncbi:hypothetical protein PILCRDRAFT_700495 [Piloderma croceum F 1598]|uniref:Uncharacterized protein n=1 Tax=Piloderma croceum (strain F 1598) TaxID=765440 RepID=A0A0C3BBE4_PILCF|nr:hypothetical protein PILCRDRAFT_700495 [Piloderma croceum F 1598]
MSSALFPVEICLMIIGEVFHSQQVFYPIRNHVDRPLHQARRTERLAWFRSIGGVCRAWLGPARTVFWEKVNLFTVPELVDFARAIDNDSAKPACIRRLYFRFPDTRHTRHSPSNSINMRDEAQRCFPVALLCLPTHLDVLHVDCPWNLYVHNETLYHCLKDANRDPA